MKNYFDKIKAYIFLHKVWSAIILIAVLLVGYWGYGKMTSTSGETRYVLAAVTKGTIISSVSGSGQVSASDEININPKVSGTITSVNVNPGDQVKAGRLLFVIDDTNAQKTVRDAELSLQNANLSLQKLQIQNSDTNLNANLSKAYDDSFNTVSNAFLDMPSIMNGLTSMFFQSDPKIDGQWYANWYAGQVWKTDVDAALVYKQDLIDSYNLALSAYNKNFNDYKAISRTSDSSAIENLISETYDTTKLLADAIKSANNYIDFVNNSMQTNSFTIPAIINTHKAVLNTDTSQINSHLSDLLSAKTNIQSSKDAFSNSDLTTKTTELSIKQAENSLSDAQQNLSDYYVRAPFDGVIASVPVQKGDNASSGTTLGTIITSQQVAVISLNEVDVAKIALGEKTTLTFDAIPDLTISGKVVQIDSLGTVSQGVVNYNVKISFDMNDARVKPGMSVSAEIITSVKQDVLTVPNSAIKNQGGTSYVQMFDTALPAPATGVQGSVSVTPPINQTVQIGVSDDTSTEIVSGLKEGDQVVTKTITSATSTTSSTPSLLNAVSGNRGTTGGGATRVLRGD